MKRKLLVAYVISAFCIFPLAHPVIASGLWQDKGDVKSAPSSDGSTLNSPDSDTSTEEDSDQIAIDGFRGYAWGTSLADIVNAELTSSMVSGVDYTLSDNVLFILDGEVSNYKANVGYFFDSALKLGKAAYLLDEEHIDYYSYYQDYCNLEELYETKYGTPAKQEATWTNDLYKENKEDWGTALAAGHVTFYTKWEDSNGNSILIENFGDNAQIYTRITYKSSTYVQEKNTNGI